MWGGGGGGGGMSVHFLLDITQSFHPNVSKYFIVMCIIDQYNFTHLSVGLNVDYGSFTRDHRKQDPFGPFPHTLFI